MTASDLIYPSEIEIVNPELYLASLDSADARLEMELTVEKGKGFRSSDGREPPSLGVIPVDAIFSPIRRVNYRVENTRVGERTDLDSLIIEIQTDGTISPMEALVQAASLLIEQFSVFTDLQAPRPRAGPGQPGDGLDPDATSWTCRSSSLTSRSGPTTASSGRRSPRSARSCR